MVHIIKDDKGEVRLVVEASGSRLGCSHSEDFHCIAMAHRYELTDEVTDYTKVKDGLLRHGFRVIPFCVFETIKST